ncbi:MAG: hypothetical protein AABW83_02360 [Nanoarchaeota archaeon]|mgnify:CR=1 FL=1
MEKKERERVNKKFTKNQVFLIVLILLIIALGIYLFSYKGISEKEGLATENPFVSLKNLFDIPNYGTPTGNDEIQIAGTCLPPKKFVNVKCEYNHLTHAIPIDFKCVPHSKKPGKFVGVFSKCTCIYTDPLQTCEDKGEDKGRELSTPDRSNKNVCIGEIPKTVNVKEDGGTSTIFGDGENKNECDKGGKIYSAAESACDIACNTDLENNGAPDPEKDSPGSTTLYCCETPKIA